MRTLLQDVRYGMRLMAKKPGFSAVIILTLALGIGANTAIFSVVQAVLLNPLPINEADRVVTFSLSAPAKKMSEVNITPGLFATFKDRTQTLDKLAAYETGSVTLSGSGQPEQLEVAAVTSDYFVNLGIDAIHGRTFASGEDTPGKENVVVLSYELWQRRFNGGEVVGRSINLENVPTMIIGVMPPRTNFPHRAEGESFPSRIDLWQSLPVDRNNINFWNYHAIGRLKPGVTLGAGQRELQHLWEEFVAQNDAQLGAGSLGPGAHVVMTPLQERIVGNIRTPLLVLMAGAALVLLIACANIANLLLARSTARRREIALRRCLGAAPLRILRQLLTESVLLSVIGGVLGLLLATWAIALIQSLLGSEIPMADSVKLDTKVLLFAVGISMLTGITFGLAPALRGSRLNLQETIKEGARVSASRGSRRLGNAFVVSQIALSLVLLIGAALLVRSFRNLVAVDPGFRPQNVLSATVSLPKANYPEDSQIHAFYNELLTRVQHSPGVTSAALCQIVPFSGGGGGYAFTVEGYTPREREPARHTWRRSVTPDYFSTMGISLLRGRPFNASDKPDSPLVTIVDEKMAAQYWPNEDPIGKRLRLGGPTSNAPWLTIVGVVRSVKNRRLDENASFYVYQPFMQWPQRETSIVIKTSGDPLAVTSTLRGHVGALDPLLPLFEVTTLEDSVARTVSARRLASMLLVGFAVTALLLAAIGIYGVISLNVNNRTNEFGIRLALGAQPRDVLKMIIFSGLRVAVAGMAIGVAAAFALTRLMERMLFGVSPTDPVTFALVAGVLVLVALAASFIPARRATKVDPLIALRYE